jgi:hypothetical protein
MPRKILLVSPDNAAKPLLRLEVLEADMPHPGWIRFTMQASAPGWEDPTVCWYRIPADATHVELQSEVTDADVMQRANTAATQTP